METVTIGHLKQRPREIVDRVAETGVPVEITVAGQPTGVVIGPAKPKRKQVLTFEDMEFLGRDYGTDIEAEWAEIDALRNMSLLSDPNEQYQGF